MILWLTAAHWREGIGRARLAELLWEGVPERDARRNLTNALVRLGRWLPARLVRARGDTLHWDTLAGVALDLAEMAAALTSDDRLSLAGAAALWRGPFLDGVAASGEAGELDGWLQIERAAWSRRYLELLVRLVDVESDGGHLGEAERWAARGLTEDPANERFHRARLLARRETGDRAGALAAFAAYQAAVAELGLPPDAQMVALRDAVANGRGGLPLRSAGGSARVRRPCAEGRLIGRDDLFRELRRALGTAQAGGPPVVLLRGEAGVGKSRLVGAAFEAVSGAASPRFANRLIGRCHEAATDLGFAPFVEAMNGAIAELDLEALGYEDVWLAELSRLLPELQARRPELVPRPAADAEVRRQRLFQSIGRFLGVLPHPTLLAIEDVHWLDEASLALLGTLAHAPGPDGLAFLLTLRTGAARPEVEQVLGELRQAGRLTQLDVGPLDEPATGELAAQVAGPGIEPQASWLHRETGGNPLYVVHLARTLAPGANAPPGAQTAPAAVPQAIAEIVRGRLGQLAPAARDLAMAVAICPRGAPFDFARAVAELPEGEALDALDALVQAVMLTEADSGELVFSHDLVGRAVAGGMTQARRRAMHGRAFRLLIDATEGDETRRPWAARLALHASQAGLWEPAARWSRIAALVAGEVGAGQEATEHLRNGLSYLRQMPPSEQARRLGIELHLAMAGTGPALSMPSGERALAEAERDARDLQDDRLRIDLALTRVTQLSVRGRSREGIPMAERLLVAARAAGEPQMLASALRGLGILLSLEGDLERTLALLEEAVEHAEIVGDRETVLGALGTIAIVNGTRGDLVRAEAVLARIIALTEPLGSPMSNAYALANVARVRLSQGRWDEAAATARRGIALGVEAGHELIQLIAGFSLGPALLGAGDFLGAVEALSTVLSAHERADSRLLVDRLYAYQAIAYARQHAVAAARLALERARALASGEGYRYGLALCAQAEAIILGAEADRPRGANLAREAIERFGELGARPDVARCHRLVAELSDGDERNAHDRRANQLAAALDLWDLRPTAAAGAGSRGRR